MLSIKHDHLVAAICEDLLLKEIKGHPAFKELAHILNINLADDINTIANATMLTQRIASTMRLRHLDIKGAISYIKCFDMSINPSVREYDLATEVMASLN